MKRKIWVKLQNVLPDVSLIIRNNWILLVLVLLPIAYIIYTTFLEPRPYYVLYSNTDIENDYFYNARLLSSHLPLNEYQHPGTPIYYLGYFVMLITGSGIESAQSFFNVSYCIIGLLTAIAIYIFVRSIFNKVPKGFVILATAAVFAWPSTYTFLNHFGSDAFIVPVGLLGFTFFWNSLMDKNRQNYKMLGLTGIVAGIALAIKMTFVPSVFALLIGCCVQVLGPSFTGSSSGNQRRSLKKVIGEMLIMPVGLIITYLIITIPIYWALPNVWLNTLLRVTRNVSDSNLIQSLVDSFSMLFNANPVYLFMIFILLCIFLFFIVTVIIRNIRSKKIQLIRSKEIDQSFNYLAGGVFLGIMLLVFIFSMIASPSSVNWYAENGEMLKYAAPSALAFPFVILYCYHVFRKKRVINTRSIQIILASLGIVIITITAGTSITNRIERIGFHESRASNTIESIINPQGINGRIAFWDGSPGDRFGEASFHYWGNYNYTNNVFDIELAEKYPNYTLFHLRNILGQLNDNESNNESEFGALRNIWGSFKEFWNGIFTVPANQERPNKLITGNNDEMEISYIVFPEYELREIKPFTLGDLSVFIEEHFGKHTVLHIDIDETRWVVISLTNAELKSQ